MTAVAHPRLPGQVLQDADLGDVTDPWPVVERRELFRSARFEAHLDTIEGADGERAERFCVRPKDAIAILAVDEDGRVLLVRQYRHPMGGRIVEIPAGALDVEGEGPEDAARRELVEEADMTARTWTRLAEGISSPGYTSERITIYRATDLEPVPDADRHVRQAEEAGIEQWWVPLDTALASMRAGRFGDLTTYVALLTRAQGIVAS